MSIKALGALQLPSQKEWAAGLGGLLAFGVIVGMKYLNLPVSDETETLLVVVLPPLIAKLVPPSDQDVLAHVNDDIAQAGVAVGKLTPPAELVANNTPGLTLIPAQLVSNNSPNQSAGAVTGVAASGPVPPLPFTLAGVQAATDELRTAPLHYQADTPKV